MHYRLRSFRRVHVESEIILNKRDISYTGVLADISMGGLFVRLGEQIPVVICDIYKLTFQLLLETGLARIVVNGMAVRITRNGIAFRFIETDPGLLRFLFHFVYQENIENNEKDESPHSIYSAAMINSVPQ